MPFGPHLEPRERFYRYGYGYGVGWPRRRGVGGGGAGEVVPTAVLMIVAGQSNSGKLGTGGQTVPTKYTTLTDAFIWNSTTSAFDAYVCGTNSADGSPSNAWGSEAEFIYRANQEFPGAKVYVVKRSVTGSTLATDASPDWNPANAEIFSTLESRVAAARVWLAANAVTLSHEVTAWAQGEADMNNDAYANAYPANFAAFMTAYRSRISTGLFIQERTRPPGHDATNYTRGYVVREAQNAQALTGPNHRLVDTDFLNDGFTNLHPAVDWTEGCGLRVWHAFVNTYTATYGSIDDTTPSAFTVPDLTGQTPGATVTSAQVAVDGIQKATAIAVTGAEFRVLHPDGSTALDWGTSNATINKFQTFQLRRAASGSDNTALDATVTIGGVSDTWTVTTGVAGGYNAETTAYVARMTGLGVTALTTPQADALDAFITAGKSAGWWNDMAVGYFFANPSNRETGKINVKDAAGALATETGTLTWAAADGFGNNAQTNVTFDMKVNPSALPQNAVALVSWYTAIGGNGNHDFRSTAGTGGFFGQYVRSDGTWRMNLNNINITRTGLTTALGFRCQSRVASNDVDYYGPAGTQIDTSATTSATPTGTDFFLGVPGAAGSNRVVAAGMVFGAALDATKAQSIRDALNALGWAWGWTAAEEPPAPAGFFAPEFGEEFE